MIIRPLDRDTDVTPVPDGGSDAAVITAERAERAEPAEPAAEPAQLELSCRTGANGYQIVSVAGELDIATAEQAYSYLSEVIDGRAAPVTVDLSGLTFCDASGLGVLARAARDCFGAAAAALDRAGAPADVRRRVADFAEDYVLRGRCPADDTLEENR